MNLNNLFEGAIDELERRRIEDLEAKMDDLAQRAREATDPKHVAALRHEFAKCKAERDSYHYVREDDLDEHGGGVNGMNSYIAWRKKANQEHGITEWKNSSPAQPEQQGLIPVNSLKGNIPQVDLIPVENVKEKAAPGKSVISKPKADISGNKPVGEGEKVDRMVKHITKSEKDLGHDKKDAESIAWATANKRGYLDNANKKKHVEEAANPAQQAAIAIAKKKEQDVDEGWSNKMVARRTGQAPTPYSVYIKGKEWKSFPDDDHAENVANKLKAKFEAEGRDPSVITIAPTGYDKDIKEDTGSWIVYDPETKQIKKRFKTHTAGKSYAQTHNLGFASSEYYFDNVKPAVAEDSMAAAEKHPDGPEFTGYWKGKDSGTPGNKMVGCEESEEMEEGIAGNMQVRSTPLNLRTPKVPDLSKASKGPHHNALKKAQAKRVSENFIQWAVSQGYNVTSNPAIYEAAKQEYQALNENLSKVSTEKLQALWNSHKDEERPAPVLAAKLKAVAMELKRRRSMNETEQLDEFFGPEMQAMGGALGFLKDHGIPFMAFAAVAAAYGVSEAAKSLEQGEGRFKKLAAKAIKTVDKNVIHKMANKLHDVYEKTAMAEDKIKGADGKACWDGYRYNGTKNGKDSCVKVSETEAWQKANKKDKTDGMSQKAVNAYKREHPGSKLKTAVTTKPSKLKKGSKDSKRRSSYCSRSKGQMDMHNISCAKTPDKPICAARRRWNCESQEQFDTMLLEAIEKGSELQPGQYYVWTVYFDDGSNKKIKVTKDNFDPKAYYAKQNKNVINIDFDWEPHNG